MIRHPDLVALSGVSDACEEGRRDAHDDSDVILMKRWVSETETPLRRERLLRTRTPWIEQTVSCAGPREEDRGRRATHPNAVNESQVNKCHC